MSVLILANYYSIANVNTGYESQLIVVQLEGIQMAHDCTVYRQNHWQNRSACVTCVVPLGAYLVGRLQMGPWQEINSFGIAIIFIMPRSLRYNWREMMMKLYGI